MKRLSSVFYLLLLPLVGCAAAKSASIPPLVIANVTVIDMTGAPARAGVDVVVEGSRVTAIAPAGQARVPRGARVIEARGKYLIPGLWDMHTHLSSWGEDALATLVRHGVLGVRDLGEGSRSWTPGAPRSTAARGSGRASSGLVRSPTGRRRWMRSVRR